MLWARGRLLLGSSVVAAAAVVAAALLVPALPPFVRFVATAPTEFWITAALALVVDVPLFGIGRRREVWIRPTATPGLAIAILLVWGTAPGYVVQAAAAVISAWGQRQGWLGGVFLVSRLVCSLAAAELAERLVTSVPITSRGIGLTNEDLLPFLALAGAWFTVSYGLVLLVGAAVLRGGIRGAAVRVRAELLRSLAQVLLVAPLLTVFTGWWDVLAALPMLIWNERTRDTLRGEEISRREPVTGLLNHQGLQARLEGLALYDPLRPRDPRPIGVVFVNVDATLAIGRSLGWDTHEKVIRAAADRLVDTFGADRVGRLTSGGFVVLVPGLTEVDALASATDVARTLQPVIVVDDIPFAIDPVAGVALSPEHGREFDILAFRAQLAAGEARRAHQLAGVYVKQSQDVADRRIAILAELRMALLDPGRYAEITVVYQPQVEVGTRRLVGAEALVRWTHPDWGPVAPTELLDAVEASEVMPLLTRHMLDRAAAQARAWHERGRPLRVAVNVSMQDLHNPDLPALISDTLRRYGLPPSCLAIEVTERLLVVDSARVSRAAEEIQKIGVALSLDDFGTGYASIQQLRILPLAEVKIDKSYVHGLVGNETKAAIVRSVHDLATALGMSVVAEGVEDAATASALARLPGVIGQGWHFGHPVPAAEFDEQWGRNRDSAGAPNPPR
ncbi:MAG: GGDEF domain-containing protein [Micromonosporaceae bacterium]|nr:GGDEF domain-containing protein [Micromonosporaceae bacterium]